MRSSSREQTSRLPQLDGLRGLAILLVLVWHYFVNLLLVGSDAWKPAQRLLGFTWSGVDLFFVLSGFLLGGILLDESNSPNYFKAFYARRAFRILPLYSLLVVLLAAAEVTGLATRADWSWMFARPLPLASYISFTQNFVTAARGDFGCSFLGVTWSLAIEEQFYLVLPWLLRAVPRPAQPSVLLTMVVAAPFFRLAALGLLPHGLVTGFVLTPCRMDTLLLGVLLAWVLRDEEWKAKLAARRKIILALLAMAVMAALGYGFIDPGPWLVATAGLSGAALLYAGLLWLCVTQPQTWFSRLCRWRVLRGLGGISYGVYLLHQPVSGAVHLLAGHDFPRLNGPADGCLTLAALAVTLTLAAASWRWFEKKLVRRGRSFTYH
jgi:peptidoglycan/LPS O-acetylase OafA/YrhL